MASEISNRAEIDPRAKIGNNCKIYPFAYIEGDVVAVFVFVPEGVFLRFF